jgi:hypothetical protein
MAVRWETILFESGQWPQTVGEKRPAPGHGGAAEEAPLRTKPLPAMPGISMLPCVFSPLFSRLVLPARLWPSNKLSCFGRTATRSRRK